MQGPTVNLPDPSAASAPALLYVAYSLLPVSNESAGGAEQVLAALAGEFTRQRWPITVAAASGSRVAGQLLATGPPASEADRYDQRRRQHAVAIRREVARRAVTGHAFSLIHDHSGDFWPEAIGLAAPVLATLHLPSAFYDPRLFASVPPNVYFNCVSRAQAAAFAELPGLVGVVENGIAVERFPFTRDKRDYLLWLGRICEEKGAHLAIDAAREARLPLVLAGQVYPFGYHQEYFARAIRPHLDCGRVRLVEAPSFSQKLDLLAHARAVLVPSLCEETSSLVSLEAMACGTPVIALRRGGVPEVVADGVTGLLTDTPAELPALIARAASLDSRACRRHVERSFSARRMAAGYARLYRRLLA